jgi:hypothetical protein
MILTDCNGEISVLHYRFEPWNIRYVGHVRVRMVLAREVGELAFMVSFYCILLKEIVILTCSHHVEFCIYFCSYIFYNCSICGVFII